LNKQVPQRAPQRKETGSGTRSSQCAFGKASSANREDERPAKALAAIKERLMAMVRAKKEA
jgi:hypothetical protein